MTGNALETLVDAYFAAWNEADPARRGDMLAAVCAHGATYTDPTVHAASAAELVAHIGNVLSRLPGSRVIRTSVLDSHHGMVRFSFRRVLADGMVRMDGVDFVELSDDGKLKRIVGFFGPLAAI